MKPVHLLAFLVAASPAGAQSTARRLPIIDVHLHANSVASQGPPPVKVCPGNGFLTAPTRQDTVDFNDLMTCATPLYSERTDEALMRRTLAIMEQYNVIGVASGPREFVRRWKRAAPSRIIGGSEEEPLDTTRARAAAGEIAVIGELGFQYMGMAPSDSIPESYFALAEQLDLPVALHMGIGPPGAAYIGLSDYRMRLGNPLLLEETLLKHPRLRLYVMHAGWPMEDEMVGLMWAHPQVYIDVGVISWAISRAEFHRYLKRIVEAGFGKRIMFGSDQMIWPDALRIAIENVEAATFLTHAQKRDIFYNNAARFLRIKPAT